MNRKSFAYLAGLGLCLAAGLPAQEFSHFAFNVGAGFTTPVGDTGTQTDVGWNVRAGAGVNFAPYVGLMVNAGYDKDGLPR